MPAVRILYNLTAMKLIFITLTAFAITASAQVTLEIMQTENSSFSIQTNIKLDQILHLAGQEIATQNSQTFTTEHTTEVRDKTNGTLRAKATIKPWVSKWVFSGGITMEFNSAMPDIKAPLPQLEPNLDLLRVMPKHP